MSKGRAKQIAFLYASQGPLVLRLLAEDDSRKRVFAPEILACMDRKEASPVMGALLEKLSGKKAPDPGIARWLVRQYLNHRHNGKPILAEDFYKVAEDIAYFEQLKKSAEFKQHHQTDLQQYKSLSEFQQALEPFRARQREKEAEQLERRLSPEERRKLMSETTVLYSGPEGKVVIPHTPDASIYWGSNTTWCISGSEVPKDNNGLRWADTHFPHYDAESPIIMILPKGEENNKVALVDKKLWNSADQTIGGLYPPHRKLMDAALAQLSPGARRGVSLWLPEEKVEVKEEKFPDFSQMEQDWSNCDYVLARVKKDGEDLRYADEALKRNPEIVLAAVQQNANALKYASDDLKCEREILLAAISTTPYAIWWADHSLQRDPEFVYAAVKLNRFVLQLQLAGGDFRKDQEFARKCLQESDDLPFDIKVIKPIWQPDDDELKRHRIAALERMAARGDLDKFHKHARHMKELWGDAELLFANDVGKIMSKIRAPQQDRAAPGVSLPEM